MVLSRLTPTQLFEIWNPRWHDRVVLLADYKLGTHNHITFPRANSLPGDWYISGAKAKTFPLEDFPTKNGSVMKMRAVKLNELEPLERES